VAKTIWLFHEDWEMLREWRVGDSAVQQDCIEQSAAAVDNVIFQSCDITTSGVAMISCWGGGFPSTDSGQITKVKQQGVPRVQSVSST